MGDGCREVGCASIKGQSLREVKCVVVFKKCIMEPWPSEAAGEKVSAQSQGPLRR